MDYELARYHFHRVFVGNDVIGLIGRFMLLHSHPMKVDVTGSIASII
jgi:hypothetical protein